MVPNSFRAARYAAEFEAALEDFARLVEYLTDEQWARVGRNYPERQGEEDENRTGGIIAYHVAVPADGMMGRIQALVDGRPLPTVGSGQLRQALQVVARENARHAVEHTGVTKEAMLRLLREQQRIAAALRAIADDRLDQSSDTPAGPMTVAQHIERVLIGHLMMHQGVDRGGNRLNF
jgi:hypothetical protein